MAQTLDRLGRRGNMRDDSAEILFSAGGSCEQFLHGQGCPLFGVVQHAFPLPTTASPTPQGALRDGFGEAVVACDMSEPCKFPSLDGLAEEVPVDPKLRKLIMLSTQS